MDSSKLYGVWKCMRERCQDPTDPNYHRYGGRGITLCPEWQVYRTFKTWAIETGYKVGLSIDRIDNNKGYSPENCQWLTRADNTRKSFVDNNLHHLVTAFGETKPVCEWAKDPRCTVSAAALYARLSKGMSDLEALTKPRGANSKRPLHRTPGDVMRMSCTKEKELLYAVAAGEPILAAAERLKLSEGDREQIVKRWVIYGVYYAGAVTDHGLDLVELWKDKLREPRCT